MKKIRFGMPVLLECASLAESSALCRSLGLDFVELNMGLPMYQPDSLDPDALNRTAADYGIFYTVHLDGFLNPCDFNPYISEAARRTVTETVALAKSCGIPVLNMHLSKGDYFTLPTEKVNLYDRYRGEYLALMTRFRDECTDAVGGSDVKILIENCNGYTDFHKAALDVLLESPAFGLTLDTGHSFKAGRRDEELIFANAGRLRHMHFHDASDEKGDHLPLGGGNVDKDAVLAFAHAHDCTVVLETKTIAGLTESAEWLKRKNEI
ncbi:MAG: sugar phosphate isomerase/epimerase [Clostridia bacterium]|nr:sugar phosphate isomerase/epimerase [Clostridia bacterium]MBQ8511665.1 sugar phosphate isomerase/epimerase [Clostridia bacterium]